MLFFPLQSKKSYFVSHSGYKLKKITYIIPQAKLTNSEDFCFYSLLSPLAKNTNTLIISLASNLDKTSQWTQNNLFPPLNIFIYAWKINKNYYCYSYFKDEKGNKELKWIPGGHILI